MIRTSRMGIGSLALSVALLAAACTSGASPSAQPNETTIYFGTGATQAEVYLLPMLIYGREELAKDGITLEYAALSSDEVVASTLNRNRIDVALISLLGIERAIGAGLGMRWALTNETQNTFVLVVPGDVTDLSQLKGKKIGVQDPVSLSSVVLPGLMKGAGLAQTDYETVYLAGSSNRAAALTAGTMDASILLRAVAAQLAADTNGQFKIWGTGAPAMEPAMWEGFAMSNQFRANKDLAAKFIKATLAAYERFYAGDPATMAQDMLKDELPETAGLDAEELSGDFQLYQAVKLFPTDGGLDEALYTRMNDLLVEVGQLKSGEALPYADVVDETLLEEAMK